MHLNRDVRKWSHSYTNQEKWVSIYSFLRKSGLIVYLTALKMGAIRAAHPYYVIYRELPPPPPPRNHHVCKGKYMYMLACFTVIRLNRRLLLYLAHLSRRLIGELIGYSWSGVRPLSVVCRRPSSFTMLKDLLLRIRFADQSQILCGASLGRGNDILFVASGLHDQDRRHAHIW